MASEWYYSQEGERLGPFPFTELRRRAVTGMLLPVDLVWNETMPEWAAAGGVAGLFPRETTASRAAPKYRSTPPEFDAETAERARSLLDLNFNKFIAIRIISFLWVLWLIVATLALLCCVVAGAFYLPVIHWLLAILVALCGLALYTIFVRVSLETLVVIFRISEDLDKIRVIAENMPSENKHS